MSYTRLGTSRQDSAVVQGLQLLLILLQRLTSPPHFKTFVPGKTRVPKRALPDAAANDHR